MRLGGPTTGGNGAAAPTASGGGSTSHRAKMPANPYAKHSSPRRTTIVTNPYASREKSVVTVSTTSTTSSSTRNHPPRNLLANSSSSTSNGPSISQPPSAVAATAADAPAPIHHWASNNVSHAQCSSSTARAHTSPTNTSMPTNPYAKRSVPATASAAANNLHHISNASLTRSVMVDQPNKSPSSNEEYAPKMCCKIEKNNLKELIDMGFDKDEAKDALLRYDNNLPRAATFLGNLLSQLAPDDYDDCDQQEDTTGGNVMNVNGGVMDILVADDNRNARSQNQHQIHNGNQNRPTTIRKVTPPGNATASKESRPSGGSPPTSVSAKRSLDFSPKTKRPPTKKTMIAPIFENNAASLSSKGRVSLCNTPNPYAKKQQSEKESRPKSELQLHRKPEAVSKDSSVDIDPNKTYILYFDGASKGNPGEAGAGMVIYEYGNEDKEEVWSGYLYMKGDRTNNEAEYYGVWKGMQCADTLCVKKIVVKGDSKLVVNQLSGIWQCNSSKLMHLYASSGETKRNFDSFSIQHVGRNLNRRADELANIAVHTKSSDLGTGAFVSENSKMDIEVSVVGGEGCDAESMERDCASTRVINQEDELCTALFSQSISSDEDDESSWMKELPFIVQYELIRYGEKDCLAKSEFGAGLKRIFDVNKELASLPVELISYIYAEKEGHAAPYESIMRAACVHGVTVDSSVTCLLKFSALLDDDEKGIHLLPPEPIGLTTRRIHRLFGSHRFLEVRCKANLGIGDIKRHLHGKVISVAGRKYGLLYSKPSETTQVYRLFAEKGTGISSEDEMTAVQVAQKCIPFDLNPTLCLAKYMKRMKLVFTDTVPSLTLEAGMLQRVDDIFSPQNREMTDGCGLVSREALDAIYFRYLHNREERKRHLEGEGWSPRSTSSTSQAMQRCPFSSFQGRLGGLKGMWIVDDRLGPGIAVQYRPSQLKYEVPLTAQESDSSTIDPCFNKFYHTVEIKAWDKPTSPPAHLSRDAVQILEDRGVPKEYFLNLAQKEIEELEALRSDPNRLLKRYNARTFLKDSQSVFDDDMLLRMLTANVPLDEPVMQRKVNDFIDRELTSFKEKARFQVEKSRYLRMFPDHTGLLEEDECFVALGDGQQYDIERSTHIVAMRLPSYFRGDLRKLKLVSKAKLMERCSEKSRFFQGVVVGLILSTKGNLSQAEQMSGGDFDGDGAWCCWDEEVVPHVTDCPPSNSHLIQAPPDYFKGKEMEWREPEFSQQVIRFTWRHRQDNLWLSKLCTNLSILRDRGFDLTDAIASKAFIAVDNPYVQQWTDKEQLEFQKLTQPHWYAQMKAATSDTNQHRLNQDNKVYRSTKVLGLLHDLLHKAGKGRRLAIEDQMNIHIQEEIKRAQQKAADPLEIDRIRKEMLARLKKFNQAMRAKIDSSERDDEVGRKMNNRDISELYKAHRKEIDSKYDKYERPAAFAILYEQTYLQSRERMRYNREPYVFAWAVGLDHLARIIADGDAETVGHGLAPTVARSREKAIFGKKR